VRASAAVELGHEDVEENQVGLKMAGRPKRAPAVIFFLDEVKPGRFECLPNDCGKVRFVVNEQNASRENHERSIRLGRLLGARGREKPPSNNYSSRYASSVRRQRCAAKPAIEPRA